MHDAVALTAQALGRVVADIFIGAEFARPFAVRQLASRVLPNSALGAERYPVISFFRILRIAFLVAEIRIHGNERID